MLRGDAFGELVPGEVLALALELGRHDDVDAVGLAVDMVVDPAQFLLKLVRAECDTAQHAEATGVGHRGDNVATVTEGEERELDAELVADLCLHLTSITLCGMHRISAALAFGVLAAVLVGTTRHEWHYAPAVGWIVAAAIYLTVTWLILFPMDAETTIAHVHKRDRDGNPRLSHAIVLTASLAGVAGVGYLLAATTGSERHLGEALIGVLSVIASWFAIHTAFTMRYALLYYTDDSPESISYHQTHYQPCYKDFAYLAFTVGMTYQVSDTDLASPRIRGSVLGQALVSFLLGAVVLASTINLVLALPNH